MIIKYAHYTFFFLKMSFVNFFKYEHVDARSGLNMTWSQKTGFCHNEVPSNRN